MTLKNKLTTFALLGFSAAFLGGCVNMRTVTYPNHSYNTVFKSAVTGLCAEKKLVIYEADKRKGVIKVESRSVWGNSVLPIFIYGAGGGTPSITVRGKDKWLENIIAKNLPTEKTEQGVSKSPGAKTLDAESDMDIEKQQLELEKEKLKFEKEKLEFKKKKRKAR